MPPAKPQDLRSRISEDIDDAPDPAPPAPPAHHYRTSIESPVPQQVHVSVEGALKQRLLEAHYKRGTFRAIEGAADNLTQGQQNLFKGLIHSCQEVDGACLFYVGPKAFRRLFRENGFLLLSGAPYAALRRLTELGLLEEFFEGTQPVIKVMAPSSRRYDPPDPDEPQLFPAGPNEAAPEARSTERALQSASRPPEPEARSLERASPGPGPKARSTERALYTKTTEYLNSSSLDSDLEEDVVEEKEGEGNVVVVPGDGAENDPKLRQEIRRAMLRLGYPAKQAKSACKPHWDSRARRKVFVGVTPLKIDRYWAQISARKRRDPDSVGDPKALHYDALKRGYEPFPAEGWQTEADREDRLREHGRWAATAKSDQELLDSLSDSEFDRYRFYAIRKAQGDPDLINQLQDVQRGELADLQKYRAIRERLAAAARLVRAAKGGRS